jgi:ribA/ribD-fused uncharacterized protein
MTINFFSKSDAYSEFSNFALYPIDVEGVPWPTVEHFYQAQKFTEAALQDKIRPAKKPVIAKKLAQKYRYKARADWDAIKDAVMDCAVRRKFALYSSLRELLLSTGDEEIAESAPNDYYWGVGADGSRQNRLGLLLMRTRSELRSLKRRSGESRNPVNTVAGRCLRPQWFT